MSSKAFQQTSRFGAQANLGHKSAEMTMQGTINKTGFLLLIVVTFAAAAWVNPDIALPLWPVALIGGLILALVTIFKKEWSGVTVPIYGVFEGVALGAISLIFERRFSGIVTTAVALTFGTLFVMLIAYKTRIIKVTQKFRMGVVAATGAIALVYLGSFILGMFGMPLGFLHNSSMLSIGISVVVVIVASLNLVLDFDFIENTADRGLPKYMEWYGAFGVMVTLIWLYLEILRLLSKIRSRN